MVSVRQTRVRRCRRVSDRPWTSSPTPPPTALSPCNVPPSLPPLSLFFRFLRFCAVLRSLYQYLEVFYLHFKYLRAKLFKCLEVIIIQIFESSITQVFESFGAQGKVCLFWKFHQTKYHINLNFLARILSIKPSNRS